MMRRNKGYDRSSQIQNLVGVLKIIMREENERARKDLQQDSDSYLILPAALTWAEGEYILSQLATIN